MKSETKKEIAQFTKDQYRTLFWQVHGWMKGDHREEITKAVESAMKDIRSEKK